MKEKAIDRLYTYMDSKGIKPAQAERGFSLSNGYLSKQKKRGGDLGESVLLLILENSPDLSPEWLLTGEGEMLRDSQGHTMEVKPIHKPTSKEPTEELQYIPYYSFEATAGVIELIDTSAEYEVGKIVVPNMPKCDGAVAITGDSMYPLLKSGDIVAFKLIHDINNIHYGDMYLISLNEDGDTYITVKWLQRHPTDPSKAILVSHNEHYAPREVELRHIHRIALIKLSIRYNSMG